MSSRADSFTIVPYPTMRLGEALINNYELFFELRTARKLLARIALTDCERKVKGNTLNVSIPSLTFTTSCIIDSLWLVAYGRGGWYQIHDAFADNTARPFVMRAGSEFVVEQFPITLT